MKRKTILIADDDHDLTNVLALRCTELGLDVHTASDAMTALSKAHRYHPDLICLDVQMPGGNGLSACEMLTTDDELSSLPVIMLTGQRDEDTIRRCHDMCAYYVLKCPDVWQRVEPLICELLDLTQPVA